MHSSSSNMSRNWNSNSGKLNKILSLSLYSGIRQILSIHVERDSLLWLYSTNNRFILRRRHLFAKRQISKLQNGFIFNSNWVTATNIVEENEEAKQNSTFWLETLFKYLRGKNLILPNLLVECHRSLKACFLGSSFKKWANPASFSFIFGFFKQTIQFLQKISVWKNVHPVYSARIETHDLLNISHHS